MTCIRDVHDVTRSDTTRHDMRYIECSFLRPQKNLLSVISCQEHYLKQGKKEAFFWKDFPIKNKLDYRPKIFENGVKRLFSNVIINFFYNYVNLLSRF